jgi:formylglycine-generating enzyme required for sulfatase activity
MRLPADKEIYGKKEIDPEKFIYRFENGETAAIYPDTLVWIRDFAYSYNEPLTKRYFSHPAFGNYPVLGVSQKQAMAYCDWKTRQWNAALQAAGSQSKVIIRLPSAHEWEYAAQAGSEIKTDSVLYDFILFDPSQTKGYPNPAHGEADKKIRNHGYKYNFGRIDDPNGFVVKNYAEDGSFYTAPCDAYKPDIKGFYNLHGNIAEWTSSTGGYLISEQDAQQVSGRLNKLTADFPNSPLANMTPAAAHAYLNRFIVVKGGSWESVPFYLQPGANQFYDASAQHSYIGFRTAMVFVTE